MKSLIAIVVAVGLVRVQGTSIIRHITSNDLGDMNVCLMVTYDTPSNSFIIRGTILEKDIYSKTFQVKPWSDCGIVETPFGNVMSCATISKVKIQGGRVCVNVEINAGGLLQKSFSDVCF
ncbi:hypothetical protein CHS0354_007822 [Potamilus streckersoni]|uniref:Uncharacterized protein n=1 Tax=Potamilus streckersoni TaxID=2493646 RepID=A0AAE0RR09_9BIVA|nr:hypothetical protein CHS0354_007822 [Potamilus streckersoni]